MLKDMKEKLITNADVLIELLEEFGFEKITPRVSEIRCARDADGGGNNIQIRLNNNDGAYVTDYARGTKGEDIIAYIMREKGVDFRTVVGKIQKILGLSDDWAKQKQLPLFGGFYSQIGRKNAEIEVKTYPESVLDQYDPVGNELWIKEGICLETQRFFDVRFDVENNGIVFPWRDQFGNIIAVKSRYNGNPPDNISKYYYPIGGNISTSLYGFSENYGDLYNCEALYVFEGEKSVMKMWTWGYCSSVAIGSHSLSDAQVTLLLQLNPKSIVLMLDKDLDIKETILNIKRIKDFSAFSDIKIKYWNWKLNNTLPEKAAPCDMGVEEFKNILSKELVDYDCRGDG
jgi:DNA primase